MKLNRINAIALLAGVAIVTTGIIVYAHGLPSPPVKVAILNGTNALQPVEVATIAKATLVRIEPTINSPGSGVIIGRYQEGETNVYVVLTAAHVVQYSDDEYRIVTPVASGSTVRQRQKILVSTEKDIQKLPNVDLAIVRFRSNNNYQTASLGNSDYTTEGSGVFIAGFPNPGLGITKRVFQFTSSLVSARLDGESVEGEETGPLEGGYAMSYTNVTRAGMSGGPIFDVAGRVVGIHGKGDGDKIAGVELRQRPSQENPQAPEQNQESATRTQIVKSGFNLGIPIQTFLKLIPDATQTLGVKIDTSEPGIIPGGTVIATRGGKKKSAIPPTNINEEENTDNDLVIGKSKKGTQSNPVAPNNPVPPQPTTPTNKTPNPLPLQPSTPENKTPNPTPPGKFF